MLVKSLSVQIVTLPLKQRAVAIGVFLEQQRVLLKELDALGQRLALDTACVRGMEHPDVVAEGNLAQRAGSPAQVGVLPERYVELLVESVDGVEAVVPEQQVGGHEADAFEADVGNCAVVRV